MPKKYQKIHVHLNYEIKCVVLLIQVNFGFFP